MNVFWFILGTILGSFYLVVGTRLPKDEDVIKSRSKCDSCQKTLKWYNLIPIFSYIFQKGKCSSCGQKISIEHFLVELITGLLFLFASFYYPMGYNFYISLIVISLMIIIFISDFKYMVILDSPLVVASILVIILKLIYFDIHEVIISVASGLGMFTLMLLIEKIGTVILKKDSLGGGDIKFSFLIGLILNFKLGVVALILSTFLALPYAVASLKVIKSHEFPYGPFLAGALFIVFFQLDKFNNLLMFLFNI